MFAIGIDPGLSGAIAIFDIQRGSLEVVDTPTLEITVGKSKKRTIAEQELVSILAAAIPGRAFVERVAARPGQGVSSMFSFGLAYGQVRGVLACHQIPYTLVTPAEWRRALKVPEGKDGSRQRAMELFPAYAGLFRRKCDDGRSDAALIAYWGAAFFDKKNLEIL